MRPSSIILCAVAAGVDGRRRGLGADRYYSSRRLAVKPAAAATATAADMAPPVIPQMDAPAQPSYAPAPRPSFSDRVTKCLDDAAAGGLGPNERADLFALLRQSVSQNYPPPS